MKSLFYYLVQLITCSGILYSYYHFFLRNKKFHAYNRFYLLIITTLSILIPFLHIPVYFTIGQTNSSFVLHTITTISSNDFADPVSSSISIPLKNNSFSIERPILLCYGFISIIVTLRVVLSLERIRQIKKKYVIQKIDNIYFANTNEPGTPFSFFRWLFWNQKIELSSEKGEQVFRHELFHIEQKHSLDILYMELLTIIFWINPFLHLIKKEIKVIHEFLADQAAINQNKKWEYAELLLMQSLNTKRHLTNSFFYNQIKRRIAMITSSQKTSSQYLRKVMILPVAVIAIALFAFSYQRKKENITLGKFEKPITVVIDAGHGIDPSGSHTGVTASDGSHEDDIVLTIAKKIKELNTNDHLQIILTRETKDVVDLKKRVEFSNSQNADILISLHANLASKQEKNTKGIDILYSGKNTKYFAENKILATILSNYFYQIRPVNNIKLSKKGVYMIDNSNCPSVLIECGYLTNPNDLAFIKDENGQTQIAKSILQSIEQYFLQKEMPDWEERKRVVSDTAWPVITFSRNTVTGKMEGDYNGKKFNKMTEYGGQFAFYFDDESSTMIMIGKEQTEVLKKKYGKNLNELIIQDSNKLWDSDKIEKEQSNPIKEALFVIDGKEYQNTKTPSPLNDINVNNISKINVLKGSSAFAKYGEKGKNGVIEIFTKKYSLITDTLQGRAILTEAYDKDGSQIYIGNSNDLNNRDTFDLNDNKIFEKTQVEASFPGGDTAWKEFLSKNLSTSVPHNLGAPEGTYTVWVQFIVDKEGNLSYIKPLTNYGFGMETEAIRIVQLSPNWNPAMQNGHIVKSYMKQQITFIIGKNNRDFPLISRDELKNITVTSLLKLPSETKVISFTLTMDNDKGTIDIVDNHGNTFTPQTLSLMEKATTGRFITVDKIRIDKNGTEKKVPGLIYQVTN